MSYSEAFKAEMVKKLTAPGAPSATALSEEVDVPQTTLSKWVRQAGKVTAMAKTKTRSGAKRPQDWTAEEKMAVVVEASQTPEEELGGLLRRRGLHRSDLERWRQQMLTGLAPARRSKSSPETRRIRELERNLSRKEKALAEAAALLVLQKKVQAIWGDEDDSTTPRSGK